MDTAEVAPVTSHDSRRLAGAIALLLAGACVHLWLFPSQSRPGHPGPLETVTAQLRGLAEERVAATTGDSAESSVLASTLDEVRPKPERDAPVAKDPVNRVTVLPEAVHPTIARPMIGATPVRLVTAMLRTSNAPASEPRADSGSAEPAVENPPPALREAPGPGEPETAALEPISVPLPVAAGRLEHKTPTAVRREPREADGPSEERLVSSVLQQYRAAYESLDVSAAQSVWPTVDARALGAAFRQLAGQRVTFDSCGVSVSGSGSQATARCKGQAEYVPKVGSRRAYVASGEWVFNLAKQDTAWRIINANATIK